MSSLLVLLHPVKSLPKKQNPIAYTMKDYLEVAEYNKKAEKEFQATGIARYPYIIEISKGNKHLTFIGTRHTREITQQADSIDHAFRRLQPQIAFNEGGTVKQTYGVEMKQFKTTGK